MHDHPAVLIQKQRSGLELTAAELQDLVKGVVDGSLGDAQLGAFLMAVCLNGMTAEATVALTLAMRDSGVVLRHDQVRKPKIDKHSTGGVGDKVSLLLAPLVAAAGVAVPMLCGRGLGHTGGTIDKLEAIPGYRTDLQVAEFQSVLADCGYAIAAPSRSVAPADRRMYAVRSVSGTVESIPLITSSILSKKLAAGIDGLVLDVKCGRAAFMPQEHDALALLERLVEVSRGAGVRTTALLTDMDHPLGLAIGNAVEVAEVVAALHGQGPADLLELTFALGAEMLLLAGLASGLAAATDVLRRLLADGSAREQFRSNVVAQGGDGRIVDEPDRLGRAGVVLPVPSPCAGHLVDVDPLALGRGVVELGGGRRQPHDVIDPLVGIVLHKQLGDAVAAGEPLASVHAGSAAAAAAIAGRVLAAMPVGEEKRRRAPLIRRRVAGA